MTEYLKSPNLPNGCVKSVVIDFRADNQSIEELKRLGIDIIKTTEIKTVHPAVCGHPDMQIHHMGKQRFICAAAAYESYMKKLRGAELIKGSEELKEKYPADVPYNCVNLGKYLICSEHFVSQRILREYRDKEIINVNQGYTKCQIAIVSEEAIISSDEGICSALKNKIDVFKIRSGYIDLPGFDYGFIGGATGLTAPNMLAVNGSLKTHPDGQSIKDFCGNHGVFIHELRSGTILDIGSILPVSHDVG